MFYDDEIQDLYAGEMERGSGLYKDPKSGVWTDEAGEDFGDGFSGFHTYPGGDAYESDRYDPENLDGDEAAGFLAYHNAEPRDDTRPSPWLAGYDLAASSGRDPYVKTQEDEMLQELRDELGPVDEFVREVQRRLDLAETSQAALAREMRLPKQNISRWFNGHVGMTLESMLAMRDAVEALEREAA